MVTFSKLYDNKDYDNEIKIEISIRSLEIRKKKTQHNQLLNQEEN